MQPIHCLINVPRWSASLMFKWSTIRSSCILFTTMEFCVITSLVTQTNTIMSWSVFWSIGMESRCLLISVCNGKRCRTSAMWIPIVRFQECSAPSFIWSSLKVSICVSRLSSSIKRYCFYIKTIYSLFYLGKRFSFALLQLVWSEILDKIDVADPLAIHFWSVVEFTDKDDYETGFEFGKQARRSIQLTYGGWQPSLITNGVSCCGGDLHQCARTYAAIEVRLTMPGLILCRLCLQSFMQ